MDLAAPTIIRVQALAHILRWEMREPDAAPPNVRVPSVNPTSVRPLDHRNSSIQSLSRSILTAERLSGPTRPYAYLARFARSTASVSVGDRHVLPGGFEAVDAPETTRALKKVAQGPLPLQQENVWCAFGTGDVSAQW
jgi:hypothetical protein